MLTLQPLKLIIIDVLINRVIDVLSDSYIIVVSSIKKKIFKVFLQLLFVSLDDI